MRSAGARNFACVRRLPLSGGCLHSLAAVRKRCVLLRNSLADAHEDAKDNAVLYKPVGVLLERNLWSAKWHRVLVGIDWRDEPICTITIPTYRIFLVTPREALERSSLLRLFREWRDSERRTQRQGEHHRGSAA